MACVKDTLLEYAWGIIANAYGGDWTKASIEWQQAAASWRDQWVKLINTENNHDD